MGKYVFFSAVPNRFKYHYNACYRDIVFKMVSEVIRSTICNTNLRPMTLADLQQV